MILSKAMKSIPKLKGEDGDLFSLVRNLEISYFTAKGMLSICFDASADLFFSFSFPTNLFLAMYILERRLPSI